MWIPIRIGTNRTGGSVTGTTYATWDPANCGPSIALSGGNLTEASSGTGSVRATIAVTPGNKRYWELTAGGNGPYCYNQVIGMDNGLSNLGEYTGQDNNSWGFYGGFGAGGNVLHNSGFLGSGYTAGYAPGSVIGVALDLAGWTIQFYINGSPEGIPVSIPPGSYYPAAGSGGGTMVATANFGASPFVYTVPPGFTGGVY